MADGEKVIKQVIKNKRDIRRALALLNSGNGGDCPDIPDCPPSGPEFITYERPADWLDIKSLVTSGEEKYVGLVSISESSVNPITIQPQGAATVDWGNATQDNIANGVTFSKRLDWADYPGTEDSFGNRQAIVTITPQVLGGSLTSVDFTEEFEGVTNPLTYSWLDFVVSSPFMNRWVMTAGHSRFVLLKSVEIIGPNVVNTLNMGDNKGLQQFIIEDSSSVFDLGDSFANCTSLLLPVELTAAVTATDTMYLNCTSLQKTAEYDWSEVLDTNTMYHDCPIKTEGDIFLPKATNVFGMYSSSGLETMGDFSAPLAVTAQTIWNACLNLVEVGNINLPIATNFYQTFVSCNRLKKVGSLTIGGNPLLSDFYEDTWAMEEIGSIVFPVGTTGARSFFKDMLILRSLENVTMPDLTGQNDLSELVRGMEALEELPAWDFSTLVNTANCSSFARDCYRLSRVKITNISVSINFQSCALDTVALVEIFNNLTVIAGKTITITNCLGATALTAPERAIATDKGWTIIG